MLDFSLLMLLPLPNLSPGGERRRGEGEDSATDEQLHQPISEFELFQLNCY